MLNFIMSSTKNLSKNEILSKKWVLKKIKIKNNILFVIESKISGQSLSEFQWTNDEMQLILKAT